MYKTTALVATVLCIINLSGCVIVVDHENQQHSDTSHGSFEHAQKNRNIIANLTPNMTAQQVKEKLGTPDFHELIQRNDHVYEVLFYRTHRTHSDGMTTKDECTPVVIEDNVLIGWGDTTYKSI